MLSQHHAVQFPFTVLGVARLGRYPHDDPPDARNQAIAEESLAENGVLALAAPAVPDAFGWRATARSVSAGAGADMGNSRRVSAPRRADLGA